MIVSDRHIADNPVVWVLSGFKAGDTTQMLALADALGWAYEVKRLVYRRTELLSNRLLGATLSGINQPESDNLTPPWPDLVITAGRRNEPVARWIKKQHPPTRLVHLGRPWSAINCFDLVITTPQYFVPAGNNVLHIALPLHSVTPEILAGWRRQWCEKFTCLPGPLWAVMLGGDSGPYVFNQEKAVRLAGWLNRRVESEGGAVLVTNSARTSPEVYQAFLDELSVPSRSYHWLADDPGNPYRGYLACADNLVVTGESISMLAEAAATEKPLYIYDLADCPQGFSLPGKSWWQYPHNFRYRPMIHRLATRFAPHRMKRDVTRIHEKLVQSGRAAWAGVSRQRFVVADSPDLQTAVERVRYLMDQSV